MIESSLGKEFRDELDQLIIGLQQSLGRVIQETDDRPALPPAAADALKSLRAGR